MTPMVTHMAKKLHSYISIVRVSKLVLNQLFADVGSIGLTFALEVANRHLRAKGAARSSLMHVDW